MTEGRDRLEQLVTLSGGVDPQEQMRAFGVLAGEGREPYYYSLCDAVFADVGFFLFPYWQAFVDPDSRDNPTNMKRAYAQEAPAEQEKPLAERFMARGLFIPADEIEGLTPVRRTTAIPWIPESSSAVRFRFRNQDYVLCTVHDLDVLQTWLEAAAAKRRALTGGPSNGGWVALLEWAHRPADSTPEWVADIIHRLQDIGGVDVSPIASSAASSASAGQLGTLLKRLNAVGTAESTLLARRIRAQSLGAIRRGRRVAIPITCAGIALFGLVLFLQPEQTDPVWMLYVVAAAMTLFGSVRWSLSVFYQRRICADLAA